MPVIKLTSFAGEFPRTEARSLPDNAAQSAVNCDFSGPTLRGIKDGGLVATMPNISGSNEPIISVWTENGTSFFGWPWEVDVVKSPVIDDFQRRIIYSAMPGTGLMLKQARTRRDDGTTVIGNDNILGNGTPGSGNYKPPEISGTLTGPDSWALGIAPPKVWDTSYDDLPTVTLVDRTFYPDAFGLRLKVTYFVESPTGEIMFQKDISNNEAAQILGGTVYRQVFYTNNSDDRGHKIQDMLWPFTYTPRPLKYYWFEPPSTDDIVFARTVTETNATEGAIVITYGVSTPSTDPDNPDGPPTEDAPGLIIDNEDQ
jgi:hypothetical protein